MRVICYVGIKDEAGLSNVKKLDDFSKEERQKISERIQVQCASAVGYQKK